MTEHSALTESAPDSFSSSIRTVKWPTVRWLAAMLLSGFLLTPVFYSLPPRLKLLGLHAWVMSSILGGLCGGIAKSQGIRSRWLVPLVAALTTLACLVALSVWGWNELCLQTARRTPELPLGTVNSPQQMAQALQTREHLKQAMQPQFVDYQRLRFHRTELLQRIRPMVLWTIELIVGCLTGAIVAQLTYRQEEMGEHEQPAQIR